MTTRIRYVGRRDGRYVFELDEEATRLARRERRREAAGWILAVAVPAMFVFDLLLALQRFGP